MKKLFLYLNLCFVIGCAQNDLSDRNDIAIIDTRGVDESVLKKIILSVLILQKILISQRGL